MPRQAAHKTADATPSKAFFIDMLTRDIGIADAILDLVDNAVDKAVEIADIDAMGFLEGHPVAKVTRQIAITFDQARFTIKDNCGGISIDEAEKTVFLFGNPNERGADYGLSVYGIGMKRAFFKLGQHVEIRSQTATGWWSIVWPVAEWRKRKLWEVPISAWGVPARGAAGTTIVVSELHEAIAARLSQPSFARELMGRIAATYALFITAGIRIKVNGQTVAASLPVMATGTVTPARKTWTSDGVEILIIVGVTPLADQVPRGWYVFCNGRMVLEADKSLETGWGDVLPLFRSKYNHFVGFMYFKSEDVRLLPWRTTKQGVERESPIYQEAIAEARVQSRPVLTFLNDLYPSDVQVDAAVQRESLGRAASTSITDLPQADVRFGYQRVSKKPALDVGIAYRRLKSDVERIRRHLGDPGLSAGQVGGLTFDHYLKTETDE